MRSHSHFYTLCPSCEQRLDLTLAIKLQAARSGTSCWCSNCATEWICIQEWVFRDLPRDEVASQEMTRQHKGLPATTQWTLRQTPAVGIPQQLSPPRPHLPTFQPPQHSSPVFASQAPAAHQVMPTNQSGAFLTGQPPQSPAIGQQPGAGESSMGGQGQTHAVPRPHAWSWERTPTSQYVAPNTGQSGYPR
jgi:hypothetical protein